MLGESPHVCSPVMPKPRLCHGPRGHWAAPPFSGSNIEEAPWVKGNLPLRRDTAGPREVSVCTYLGAEPDAARGPPSSVSTV